MVDAETKVAERADFSTLCWLDPAGDDYRSDFEHRLGWLLIEIAPVGCRHQRNMQMAGGTERCARRRCVYSKRSGGPWIKGSALRMRAYLKEMFPLPRHLAFALLAALGIAGFEGTVQDAPSTLTPGAVLAVACNIFAMLLVLRLMDELKDKEIDRRLFPERPLPSGRLLESDIRISLFVVAGLFLANNLRSILMAAAAAFVLGYALLMRWRFFAPVLLKKSLLITLATHTPVFPLIWLQGFITAAGLGGTPLSELARGEIALFVVMSWLSVLGWELARKIRAAEEENEYVTYSQVLGRRGAVAAAWAAQSVAVGITIYFGSRFDLGVTYLIIAFSGWAVCCWAEARFLLRPNAHTSKLKPYAAIFAFAIALAQVYGFVIRSP